MNRYWLTIFTFLNFGLYAQKIDTTSANELSEVVVNATRAKKESGIAFSMLNKKELGKLNLGQDVPLLLNFLPSVVTTSDAGAGIGYTGIRIRGTDATRINVTINGIPFNDSESSGVYWVNMPDLASSTQSIQVQRGVGTSTNGAGAFGGSISLNTMNFQDSPSAELNVSAGSFNTQKYNFLSSTGLINNNWIFDARLSYIKSDGYIYRSGSDLKSFYTSLGYYGKSNFFRLNVFSGKEITQQAWEGVPQALADNDKDGIQAFADRNYLDQNQLDQMLEEGRRYNPYTYKNQVDNYNQTHYQLIGSVNLKRNWRFNPGLHYTKGKGYFEQFKKDQKFEDYGFLNPSPEILSTDLIRRKWLDNDFYGLVFSLEKKLIRNQNLIIGGAANHYNGKHFGDIIWAANSSTISKDQVWYNSVGKKNDVNFYFKDEFQIKEKSFLFVDLQIRNIDLSIQGKDDDLRNLSFSQNYFFFNPKLGGSYNINSENSLYSSFSIANKEPNRQDFVDNIENAIPKPEQLYDFELGYKLNKNKFRFESTLYYMSYKNQLVLTGQVNNVGNPIRQNVSKSYRAGLELQQAIAFSTNWTWAANLTLSKNKIKTFNEIIPNYGDGPNLTIEHTNSSISFSPSLIGASQLTYLPLKTLNISWNSKYVGDQYLDNTSSPDRKLKAYWVNDLSFILKPKTKKSVAFEFNFLLNNFLNTMYSSNGYTYSYIYGETITENFVYPQAGINFLTGIKMAF